MKKRPYRATSVKHINVEAIAKAVEGRKLVVAVDVAKTKMRAVLLNDVKENLGTIGWDHPTETPKFLSMLERLSEGSVMEVVMEPSGTYGHPLMHACHLRWAVFLVSGKRTHDAAEVFDGVPSTHDGKSALIIARLHLEGASRRWTPEPAERRALKAATKTMDRYQSRYLENLNEIEAELAHTWPELLGLLELNRASLLDLLAAFPCPAAARADEQGVRQLLLTSGHGLLTDERIEAIVASARTSLGVPVDAAEQEALAELARDTRVARGQTQTAKERLRIEGRKSETARNLKPLVGAATAAVLVAMLGEANAYRHVGAYLKAFGLNLRERSSGEKKGRLAITKRGSSRARKYVHLAALRVLQNDPVVKAWYHKKVARDGGQKMKALIAVTRKLVKAMWYVGRGAVFDSSRLFDVRLLQVPEPQREATLIAG